MDSGLVVMGGSSFPDPSDERRKRWEGKQISTHYIRNSVAETDILKNAQKAANDSGLPQRIIWCGAECGKTHVENGLTPKMYTQFGDEMHAIDYIEPNPKDGSGDRRPNWVRVAMGDM